MTTLALLGASGRTGRHLMRRARAQGLHVRAFVRTAPHPSWPGADVRIGELAMPQHVEDLLQGVDAVLMVLGPRPPHRDAFCAPATRVLLTAMTVRGVSRLVCVTGAMIGTDPHRIPMMNLARGMFANSCPAVAHDRDEQEARILQSDAAWTIIKPARLTEGPETGRCRVGADVRVRLTSHVSRAHLARIVLNACFARATIHRRLYIRCSATDRRRASAPRSLKAMDA